MRNVHGFAIPRPKSKVKAYWQMTAKCGAICRKHGHWNIASPSQTISSQAKSRHLDDVSISNTARQAFFHGSLSNRAQRDSVNDKVMPAPRMPEMMKPESIPFDGKRMIYRGFEMLVDL